MEIKVLDHGFVRLVDYMGNDEMICKAARVSYANQDKEYTVEQNTNLIRYLMRHKHSTPLEMVEFMFHLKMPIFVARQLVRHRTQSINELSGRYSQLPTEFYIPEREQIKAQSKSNKQGREGELSECTIDEFIKNCQENEIDFDIYDGHIENGVAKELARINLPLSTYTEWYSKQNLHNLFHLLKLRMDSHAQYETSQYANAIAKIIQPIVPIAFKAFEDYSLNAITLSALEMKAMRLIQSREDLHVEKVFSNKREYNEFIEKYDRIC